MEENNYYDDKQNRQFLDKTTEKSKASGKQVPEKKQKEETSKEKMNRTAKEVGTDVVAGVLGGGLGAAIFGSYSFFAGLLVSGYGHYTKNKYVARLGLGMMSSSSMKMAPGVKQDPKASMIDNIQERVKAFGQELQRKLLLDKLLPGKKQSEPTPEDKLSGVTLQNEVVDVPPAQAFEEKDRLEQNASALKHTLRDNPAFEENKDVERPAAKLLYKDAKDDLTDVTDHLY
jgi:hypothetical protein